jgi:hypothetical protein
MDRFIAVAVAATAVVVGVSAHAAQFIVDGEFTELSHGVGQLDYHTSATGWSNEVGRDIGYNFVMASATAGSSGVDGAVKLWDKADKGSNTWNGLAGGPGNFVALNGDYETGPIEQTITHLVVGKTYDLTFDYAFAQQTGFNGATMQSLSYSLGSSNGSTKTYDVSSHGFSGWKTYNVEITANSATEILSFLAHGSPQDPPFALISDVSLIGPSVAPEPATWGLMLIGFGGLGAMARRRRAISALVA